MLSLLSLTLSERNSLASEALFLQSSFILFRCLSYSDAHALACVQAVTLFVSLSTVSYVLIHKKSWHLWAPLLSLALRPLVQLFAEELTSSCISCPLLITASSQQ